MVFPFEWSSLATDSSSEETGLTAGLWCCLSSLGPLLGFVGLAGLPVFLGSGGAAGLAFDGGVGVALAEAE